VSATSRPSAPVPSTTRPRSSARSSTSSRYGPSVRASPSPSARTR
jgi:hypothetical protein